jgi:hypothetical protein
MFSGGPPGDLDGAGAPRWKQRALYDAMKDTARSAGAGAAVLARVSVWDPVAGATLGEAPRRATRRPDRRARLGRAAARARLSALTEAEARAHTANSALPERVGIGGGSRLTGRKGTPISSASAFPVTQLRVNAAGRLTRHR